MAQGRRLTYRVQHIPLHFNEADLSARLQQAFEENERDRIQPMISLVPSCYSNPSSQNALAQFHPQTPSFLSDVERDKTGMTECQLPVKGAVLNIDSNFLGLTQVSDPPRGDEIKMDLIFITGLDGNAFGSWTSRATGVMWPREFLRNDLPAARVLTYGYNTKLSNNMLHTLEDFCTQLLSSLQLARDSKEALYRPLVLIGHSYGSRVITKSIVKCKIMDSNAFHKALLQSLKKIVFFGAPHHGMVTDDIESYLYENFSAEPTGDARKALVAELRGNDAGVRRELQEFKDLIGTDLKIKIISIYERKPGRRLVQTQRGSESPFPTHAGLSASWRREGEAYVPITEESAILGLPAWLEMRIPSESDHSNMTKFDHKDVTYQLLVKELATATHGFMSRTFPSVSDGVEAALHGLLHLRMPLIYVSSALQMPELLPFELMPLAHQLHKTLAESQIWIARAEDLACRAILRGNRERAIAISSLMADEEPFAQFSLKAVDNLFEERHASPNFSRNMNAALQDLLMHTVRLNSKLQALLKDELSECPSSGTIFTRIKDEEAFSHLLSMKLSSEGDSFKSMGISEDAEPKWVPFDSLYFTTEPVLEASREEESWLEKIVQFLTQPDSSDLKLKPRRFGALQTDKGFEKVMVEFRPVPEHESEKARSLRRQAFVSIARMILCSQHGAVQSSTVPLRCISAMEVSVTPCFLFIYMAENLFGLDESLQKFATPSVKERVSLALSYSKAIAALHSASICHGLINPFNLYLQVPKSSRNRIDSGSIRLDVNNTSPMLAGFETSRSIFASSDLIDVEDRDWRVYLHPDRLLHGCAKELQNPQHDVFSLGMVLIVIGLWRPFTSFRKYQEAQTEREKRDFSAKLRKQFRANDSSDTMPWEYRDIVSYCLGRSSSLPGQLVDTDEERLLSSYGHPKAACVIDALTSLYERLI